jgi:hypothetical protein
MIRLSRANVAGTYIGTRQGARLELRVDVGEDGSLDIISGDLAFENGPGDFGYHHSFQTTGLVRDEVSGGERLRGAVKVHRGDILDIARLDLVIPPAGELIATYVFNVVTSFGARPAVTFTFPVERVSSFFRRVELEVDQVQGAPLPEPFQTDTHPDTPSDLLGRTLTFASAYRDAGVDLEVTMGQQNIPVALAGFDGLWTDEELHAAMKSHFSAHADMMQWRLYLLLATRYVDPGVLGIMFDSGDDFPRQGAAVFHDHPAIAQAPAEERAREYLYTIVHELGHAFNCLHSFDKGGHETHGILPRPNSLSWMNYPHLFPFGLAHPPFWNGSSSFWPQFRFEFDRGELAHLRHNDSLEVIMGGRSFGFAGHLEERPFSLPSTYEDVSLFLWFPASIEFLQQLEGDVRLRNEGAKALDVSPSLHPGAGSLNLLIRRASERFPKVYRHFASACVRSDTSAIEPAEAIYQELTPSFGLRQWFIDEPGNYEIQAVVILPDGRRVASNIRKVRVLVPKPDADALAPDFFTVGIGTYFGVEGSRSESMAGTREALETIKAKLADSQVAKQAVITDAVRDTRVFKDVARGKVETSGRPDAAEKLLDAMGYTARRKKPSLADDYSHLRLTRQMRTAAQACAQEGNAAEAVKITKLIDAFLSTVKAPRQAINEQKRFTRSLKLPKK